jgi:hypothetical protein
MKKILFLTLIAGALLFSASCERKGTIYEIPEGASLLSFPTSAISFNMVAADGNKITVQLNRGNTKGALSVPFQFSDGTEGVFKPAKNTFDFADGEGVASVDITYPDINAFGGEKYEMVLTVDEAQVSPSGNAELKVSAKRVLTRKFLGTGTFVSGWFEGESWEQDIYTTEEAPDYFILPDCWIAGTDFTFTMVDGVPVYPDFFDTGLPYSPDAPEYGNIWLIPDSCTIEDGAIVLTTYYALPKADHVWGFTDNEVFILPEGLTL